MMLWSYIPQQSKTHDTCICLCYLSPHKNFKETRSFGVLLPHHNFMPGVTNV